MSNAMQELRVRELRHVFGGWIAAHAHGESLLEASGTYKPAHNWETCWVAERVEKEMTGSFPA